jgi:hypothetical protein
MLNIYPVIEILDTSFNDPNPMIPVSLCQDLIPVHILIFSAPISDVS